MNRIIGIDFSGGAQAGRKIWIAVGRVEGATLLIEDSFRGEALPDSGRDRARCLAALRAYIRSVGEALIGLDFPFSLPRELLEDSRWEPFIRSFPDRFGTPQAFRHFCLTAGRGRELKRLTDLESKTPFSPYNLRLYRQTYFGLREVIGPLVNDRAARVLPMQTGRSGRPRLIEICPASTLKRLAWYRPYKGTAIKHRQARAAILQSLSREGVQLAGQLKPIVLAEPEGDALDSVIAAWATYRALPLIDRGEDRAKRIYRLEGYVYV